VDDRYRADAAAPGGPLGPREGCRSIAARTARRSRRPIMRIGPLSIWPRLRGMRRSSEFYSPTRPTPCHGPRAYSRAVAPGGTQRPDQTDRPVPGCRHTDRHPLGPARDTAVHRGQYGHDAAVELLLKRGADVEAETGDGQRPLHAAAAFGHAAVVKRLLDHGADADALTRAAGRPTACGGRPARRGRQLLPPAKPKHG